MNQPWPNRRRTRPRSLMLCIGLTVLAAAARLQASDLRPILVPADDRSVWPAGNWVPVAGPAIAKSLAAQHPEVFAPGLVIGRAVYSAEFEEAGESHDNRVGSCSLRGGFTWNTIRPTDEAGAVQLGRPDVALWNLAAAGRQATWGLTGASRVELRVDQDQDVVSGKWAASGFQTGRVRRFRFRFPPALSTELHIALPGGLRVEPLEKTLLDESTSVVDGRTLWVLKASRTGAVSFIVRPATVSPGSYQITYERDIDLEIAAEDVNWRTVFGLSIAGVRPRSVSVTIPSNAAVVECRVGDTEIPAARPVTLFGESVLQMPVPPNGPVKLDIRGKSFRSGSAISVPRVKIPGAFMNRAAVSVAVRPPLQVARFESVGYRQLAGDLDIVSGDRMEFVQETDSARLSVSVAPPEAELLFDAVQILDLRHEVPAMELLATIEATAGSSFEIRSRWQSDWTVTDVAIGDGLTTVDWRVSSDESGQPELVIALPKPVLPGRPIGLRIRARSGRAAQLGAHSIRALDIEDARQETGVFVVITPSSRSDARFEIESLIGAPVKDLGSLPTHKEVPFPHAGADGSISQLLASLPPQTEVYLVPRASTDVAAMKVAKAHRPQVLLQDTELNNTDPDQPNVLSAAFTAHSHLTFDIRPSPTLRVATEYVSAAGRLTVLPPITIPSGAENITIHGGDNAVPFQRTGNLITCSSGTEARRFVLAFSMRSERGHLSSSVRPQLPVLCSEPAVDHSEVLATSVAFSGPRGFLAIAETKGREVTKSENRFRWVFGPLIREPEEELFKPWSTTAWESATLVGQPSERFFLQGNERIYLGNANENITFRVIDRPRILAYAWLAWLLAVLAITVLRMHTTVSIRWTVLAILGAGLFATLVGPNEIASIVGGFVCGAGFGLLLPRRLLCRANMHDEIVDSSASTQVGMAVGVLVAGWVMPSRLQAESEDIVDVLIPVTTEQLIQGAALPTGESFVRERDLESLELGPLFPVSYIQNAKFHAFLESGGIVLESVYRVMAPHGATSVRIPLGPGVSVDPRSIRVSGREVVGVPLDDELLLPIADDLAGTKVPGDLDGHRGSFEVSFTMSLELVDADNGIKQTMTLPFGGVLDLRAEIGDGLTLVGPAGIQFSKDSAIRILPSDAYRLRLRSGSLKADPTNAVAARGKLTVEESGLSTHVAASIELTGLFEPADVLLTSRRDWAFLAKPTQVAVMAASSNKREGDEASFSSDVAVTNGLQRATTINFRGAPDGVMRLEGQLIGRPLSRNSAAASFREDLADVADRIAPAVTMNGRALDVAWEVEVVEALTADVKPVLSSTEARGTLTDDGFSWVQTSELEVESPMFALTCAYPSFMSLSSVAVFKNGRAIQPRVTSQTGRFDILFDGPVKGELSVESQFELPRPRRGRLPLPRMTWLGCDSDPTNQSLTITNLSFDRLRYVEEGEVALDIWDQPETLQDWMSGGPRSLVVTPANSKPRLQSALFVRSADVAQLSMCLDSDGDPTRRLVSWSPVARSRLGDSSDAAEANQWRANSESATLLRTTSSSKTARHVVELESFDPVAKIRVDKPRAANVAASEFFVAVASESKRRVENGFSITGDAIPRWLVDQLDEQTSWNVYQCVDQEAVLASDALGESQLALDTAIHCILPNTQDSTTAGVSLLSVSQPGTISADSFGRVILESLAVDGLFVPVTGKTSLKPGQRVLVRWTSETPEVIPTLTDTTFEGVRSELLVIPKAFDAKFVSGFEQIEVDDALASPAAELLAVLTPGSAHLAEGEPLPRGANNAFAIFTRVQSQPASSIVDVKYSKTASRTRWPSVLLYAVMLALSLLLIARNSIYRFSVMFVERSPRVLAGVLAVVWWAFFTPSFLGFLILLAVCVDFVRNPRAGRSVTVDG